MADDDKQALEIAKQVIYLLVPKARALEPVVGVFNKLETLVKSQQAKQIASFDNNSAILRVSRLYNSTLKQANNILSHFKKFGMSTSEAESALNAFYKHSLDSKNKSSFYRASADLLKIPYSELKKASRHEQLIRFLKAAYNNKDLSLEHSTIAPLFGTQKVRNIKRLKTETPDEVELGTGKTLERLTFQENVLQGRASVGDYNWYFNDSDSELENAEKTLKTAKALQSELKELERDYNNYKNGVYMEKARRDRRVELLRSQLATDRGVLELQSRYDKIEERRSKLEMHTRNHSPGKSPKSPRTPGFLQRVRATRDTLTNLLSGDIFGESKASQAEGLLRSIESGILDDLKEVEEIQELTTKLKVRLQKYLKEKPKKHGTTNNYNFNYNSNSNILSLQQQNINLAKKAAKVKPAQKPKVEKKIDATIAENLPFTYELKRQKQDFEEHERWVKRWSDACTDSLVNFAKTGKFSIKDMTDSIISDFIRIEIRRSIIEPLFRSIFGISFSAGGSGGSTKSNSSSIKSANPVPLVSQSAPISVQVVDQRASGARPTVKSETLPDGSQIVSVLVRDEVKSALADGSMDKVFSSQYGLKRRGAKR